MEQVGDAALLQIHDLSYAYPDREVLHHVNLSIAPGEILVLLGPNGAGKSTLVKSIAGQLRPSNGSVRIAGRDPASDREARRAAGFVPQRIAIFDRLTVRENFDTFGQVMGVPRAEVRDRTLEVQGLVGLSHRSDDLASSLSGGMQRLVNIGAAMMHGPQLMVLDEPTVGVDTATRERLKDVLLALKRGGLAILLTTHDMEEAEALADRISVIVGGVIMAEGPPADIIEDAFGSKQEVRVVLDASCQTAKENSDYCAKLERLGLQPSADRAVWQGLIDDAGRHFSAITKQTFKDGSGVLEVRVRRPGLRAVLEWYMK